MDEIENQPLNFYDAKLTFRKKEGEKKIVTVAIRYTKKGHVRKKEFSEEDINDFFQEGISDENLCWKVYHKEYLAIYHRREANEYIDRNHSIIHIDLGQKLERLVSETNERLTKTRR